MKTISRFLLVSTFFGCLHLDSNTFEYNFFNVLHFKFWGIPTVLFIYFIEEQIAFTYSKEDLKMPNELYLTHRHIRVCHINHISKHYTQ